MTRRRFIADQWDRDAGTAALTGEQAAHLARVLRASPGQLFDVVAGGFLHRAEIVSVRAEAADPEVLFRLHEELTAEVRLDLHLLLAVFKFDHLEWAIQKTTELGADRISPVLARRTEKHLAQAAEKRADRWQRIALEAAKQSRRTSVPTIDAPAPLRSVLAAVSDRRHRVLLSEVEESYALVDELRHSSPAGEGHALAIGPEGGWTPEELTLFAQHGWRPVTLGPRILRAETAAVAGTAILGALTEDRLTEDRLADTGTEPAQ